MVVSQAEKKSIEGQIHSIPMVEEYVDVFSNEVPGLPLSRDIDFTIDLIPETSSMFVAPYRMTLTELEELN